jgi:hypothetical protein
MRSQIRAAIVLAAITVTANFVARPTVATGPSTQPATPTTAPAAQGKAVEVCFVLDTTGSMSGLIDGAKRKIWSIANSIVAANHGGSVRFALVPYRDRGDEYVTKVFALTDDLDKVYQDLGTFVAAGGGDTPESVNQALDDAVKKVQWSTNPDVTRLVFLVGDAPPHMDYLDDVKYPDTCQAAMKKGLIINTVQCGEIAGTREEWQRIARLSEGSYVALEQSGGMVTIETPLDKQIADLSTQIAGLAMPYGSAAQQREVATKNETAASQPAAIAADRAVYNAASGGKAVQGRGDLISDLREKQVKLEELPKDQLPKYLQDLPREQQLAKINEQSQQRDELTKRVTDLSRQRQAFIDAENKRLNSGKGDAFDAKVSEIVQKQLEHQK